GASTHLLGVINDVLDMSKIEADRFELSPISFDFEKLLQRVCNVINIQAGKHRQRLQVNIDREIPQFLIGDDQRLAQVLTNLLSNAVKFSPQEGIIQLSAQLLAETAEICHLQISVTDQGIGMSKEQQSRLFKSFEQAECDTSRKYGGTGLGLAISKRIVEMMDGEIKVKSEPGKGSVFTFTVKMQHDLPREKALPAGTIPWSCLHLILVDNDPSVNSFFTEMAAALQIPFSSAICGEDALELIPQVNESCIFFIAESLPDISGLDLARHIRSEIGTQPIICLLNCDNWNTKEADLTGAGVDNRLSKPLFSSDIFNLISEHFGTNVHLESRPHDEDKVIFTGRSVLLAEDVEVNREILLALLEPTELTIDCAADGAQAVAMFSASPEKYDLIFMDIQMPELDGYEATRSIRELDDTRAKAVPIIAMTANVFREDVERCIEAGMNGHIGKPLDFDTLVSTLREHLP
ncbi:MAG: response regulator, partial [Symbiobacteriaceae bacterium]|nr:response regulator [Symbiobacteriaceae bacterium]